MINFQIYKTHIKPQKPALIKHPRLGFMIKTLVLRQPWLMLSHLNSEIRFSLYIIKIVPDQTAPHGKQYGPRSDCSSWSSLIWVHTVFYRTFQNTTVVVNGGTTFCLYDKYCYQMGLSITIKAIFIDKQCNFYWCIGFSSDLSFLESDYFFQ